MMPIHWGLFDLALHAWRQPIRAVAGAGGGEGDSGLVSGAGEAYGGCGGGGGSVGLVAVICSFLIRQWFFYFRIALAELIDLDRDAEFGFVLTGSSLP